MTTRTEAKALKAIDRYNRANASVRAMEDKLYEARERLAKLHKEMWESLPDGAGITAGPGSRVAEYVGADT